MPYRSTHIRDVECAACKKPFRPYNERQLTCSPECARKRKTEKQSAARKGAEQRRLAEAADLSEKIVTVDGEIVPVAGNDMRTG